jgi:hypothetical protein
MSRKKRLAAIEANGKDAVGNFCTSESHVSQISYSRDHNWFPVPASALFSSRGPRDRGLSTSVLVCHRGCRVMHLMHRIE